MLVEVCYPYAAGSKDFCLIHSLDELRELLSTLPARSLVNVYRQYDLPLRGAVDEELIQAALRLLPSDTAYLIVYQNPRGYSPSYASDVGHAELETELRRGIGQQIAIGPDPPWGEHYSNILCAVIPDAGSSVQMGIY